MKRKRRVAEHDTALLAKPPSFGDRVLELATRDGDWDALKDYLKRGFPPTPDICKFLVGVFLGEIKRPRRKPKQTAAKQKRDLEIGGFVEELKRQGVRNPILQAQKLFRASRSTVEAAKRQLKKLERNDPEAFEFVMQARGWACR